MNANSNVLVANKDLAKSIGLEAALVYQQIKYWVKHCGKNINEQKEKWIYNSLEEWHKQFFFGHYQN